MKYYSKLNIWKLFKIKYMKYYLKLNFTLIYKLIGNWKRLWVKFLSESSSDLALSFFYIYIKYLSIKLIKNLI